MGIYKLEVGEIEDSMEEWLHSLEGDFDVKDIAKAFNNIAFREGWKERLEEKNLR